MRDLALRRGAERAHGHAAAAQRGRGPREPAAAAERRRERAVQPVVDPGEDVGVRRPRARRRAEPQARAPRQQLYAVEGPALVADAPPSQEQPRLDVAAGRRPVGPARRREPGPELAVRLAQRGVGAQTRRARVEAPQVVPDGPVPPVRGRGVAALPRRHVAPVEPS